MTRNFADVVEVLNAAGCVSTLVCITPNDCTVAPTGHKSFTAGLSMAVRMTEALEAAGFQRLPTMHTLGIRVRF